MAAVLGVDCLTAGAADCVPVTLTFLFPSQPLQYTIQEVKSTKNTKYRIQIQALLLMHRLDFQEQKSE